MKKLLLLLPLLIACGPSYTKVHVCSCAQMEKVMYFVERTTRDANNFSDEEMEDVVNELFRVGVMTNCPQKTIEYNDGYVVGECETAYRIYP